ncbi:hypothetical protein BS78_K089800 [Paspalum vaginatum]|uniref:Myb/SANT-like domain-containing protein n=1 Tax=Paspalum vaginatum TaxID=158149 RepID=A0A9W7X871_9POAL|nr:hypothetical protein BS78_K089800 [Paspalum vaginatum]
MLSHLANVVASGAKTSSGFKKVHLNTCAKAINEKFNTRKISASGWDETNFIITLDEEHYNNYVATHKSDAEYLNKPLEHYGEIQTIFGNSMATRKFAKDSNATLGVEDVENDVEETCGHDVSDATIDHGATSANKLMKARVAEIEEKGFLNIFKSVGDNIAKAIEKVAAPPTSPPHSDELPDDLFDMVLSIPGFQGTHSDLYFQYLVANPNIGKAFVAEPPI